MTSNTGIVIRESLNGRIRRSRDYIRRVNGSNGVAAGANQLGPGCAMGFMLKDRIITTSLLRGLGGGPTLRSSPRLRFTRT